MKINIIRFGQQGGWASEIDGYEMRRKVKTLNLFILRSSKLLLLLLLLLFRR